MNAWFILQVVVDILLLLLVIVFVLRESKKELPDVGELRALVDDFRAAVEESRKTAQVLDEQLEARRRGLAALAATFSEKRQAGGPGAKTVSDQYAENAPSVPVEEDQADNTAQPLADYKQQIKKLYDEGVSKEEIIRRLAVSPNVVELVVAMLDKEDR